MRYYHYHGETAYYGTVFDEYSAFPDDEELDIKEYEETLLQQLFNSYSYLDTLYWGKDPDDPNFEKEFKAECTVYLMEITEEEYNKGKGAD